ncbi:hypothetical protein BAE44_0000645 [Dichanthelium oligosanthes]|uniref:Ubiquitin-like protease family profile domain-containing protein n=1 Tax=Dichanthelium oligosanthes TaxID=888268 RepID=A0A1E5WLP5_9POAL|nr:hypothetical protein BAE44_0000645 [Dichanthelium oligosanthes]
MGRALKNFQYELNKLVKKGTEPNWHHFPHQEQYWQEFVGYKQSKESQATSSTNMENSKKNVDRHHMGSRGFIRKIDEWEAMAKGVTLSGATLETDGWEERAVRYLLARDNANGTLCYSSPAVAELGRRIREAQEEVDQGLFTPDRENDVKCSHGHYRTKSTLEAHEGPEPFPGALPSQTMLARTEAIQGARQHTTPGCRLLYKLSAMNYHYVLIDINLDQSRIEVYDSKQRDHVKIQPLIDLLNTALVKYKKRGGIIYRPFKEKFEVIERKWILRQPPDNNLYGFYVMHYMYTYSEDSFESQQRQNSELRTSELLLSKIMAHQDQLSRFIMDHVVAPDGGFNVIGGD